MSDTNNDQNTIAALLKAMHRTQRAQKELLAAFCEDRKARLEGMTNWIQSEESRLAEAQRLVKELPQRIALMKAELAVVERLAPVSIEEMFTVRP